jgi:hypothetical protein
MLSAKRTRAGANHPATTHTDANLLAAAHAGANQTT